jgi:hypothetical protein
MKLVESDKELLKTMTEAELVDKVIGNITKEINRLHEVSNQGLLKVYIEYTSDYLFDVRFKSKENGELILVQSMKYFNLEDIKRLQKSLKDKMSKFKLPIIMREVEVLSKKL